MNDDFLVNLLVVLLHDNYVNNQIMIIEMLSIYLSNYSSHSQIVFHLIIKSNINLLDI
jgi:hypothetical protein